MKHFATAQDHGQSAILSLIKFVDNINSISRKIAINSSSGSSAASAYSTYNDTYGDENYHASFGLFSSNFNQAGGPGANGGGIGFLSPGSLTITHYYDGVINFKVNPSNDGVLANTIKILEVDKIGLRTEGAQGLDDTVRVTVLGSGDTDLIFKNGLLVGVE